MSVEIDKLVKAALEAKIIEAFKTAPEAIDALVSACLEQSVNEYGGKPDYHSRETMPYLTFLARDVIRDVAKTAVREHIDSIRDRIRDGVKAKLTEDLIVDSFTKAILSSIADTWDVKIEFESLKR